MMRQHQITMDSALFFGQLRLYCSVICGWKGPAGNGSPCCICRCRLSGLRLGSASFFPSSPNLQPSNRKVELPLLTVIWLDVLIAEGKREREGGGGGGGGRWIGVGSSCLPPLSLSSLLHLWCVIQRCSNRNWQHGSMILFLKVKMKVIMMTVIQVC